MMEEGDLDAEIRGVLGRGLESDGVRVCVCVCDREREEADRSVNDQLDL